MNIVELSKAAHANAVLKGWWQEERTMGELLALVLSEVSEALEDFRAGNEPGKAWYVKDSDNDRVGYHSGYQATPEYKPCGIPSELADVCIRIFDIAGKYGYSEKLGEIFRKVENLEVPIPEEAVSMNASFAENLMVISGWLVDAYRSYSDEKSFYYLALALADTRLLSLHCGIDLEKVIIEKMAYNATRPVRHGGKVL